MLIDIDAEIYFLKKGIIMRVKVVVLLAMCAATFSCNGNIKEKFCVGTGTASGVYVSTDDPKASIEIKDNKYYMHYRGMKTGADSIYNIEITDKVSLGGRVLSDGKYLRLKNADDTMEYRILIWDDKKISLIYLSRGNTLTYRKK